MYVTSEDGIECKKKIGIGPQQHGFVSDFLNLCPTCCLLRHTPEYYESPDMICAGILDECTFPATLVNMWRVYERSIHKLHGPVGGQLLPACLTTGSVISQQHQHSSSMRVNETIRALGCVVPHDD